MKNIFLVLVAALTLTTAFAEAYIVPGRPGHGPGRPHDPRPPSPYPGNPHDPRPPVPYPGYGTVTVPVFVDRFMFANDRIDINQYVNLYQYRGFRLSAIDFTANAQYNSALISILVNGFQIAPTINLAPYPNNFRVFPNQNLIIGYGADSIMIYSNGNLNIRNVYLQLSR